MTKLYEVELNSQGAPNFATAEEITCCEKCKDWHPFPDKLCDRECEYSKQQRSFMCGACRLGSAFDVIDELPSAQPTLYGYKLEHLAYIARVMEKEGITAEDGHCLLAEPYVPDVNDGKKEDE